MTTPTRRNFIALSTAALTGGYIGRVSNAEPEPDTGGNIGTSITTNTENTNSTDTETDGTYTESTLETAREIGESAQKSTVEVTVGNRGGAGWILNAEKKHIITNSHVVANTDTDDLKITTHDNNTYNATVVENTANQIPDVALLEITDPLQLTLPELTIADDSTLDEQDTLVQVGHPQQVGTWVVAIGRYTTHSTAGWFESTLPTQPGNSGGPVLNLDGDLVGMTSGSTSGGTQDRPHKHTESPPELYTEYPEPARSATHVPSTKITNLVQDWTPSPGE